MKFSIARQVVKLENFRCREIKKRILNNNYIQTEVFTKFAKEDTKNYNANLSRFDNMYSQLAILKGKKIWFFLNLIFYS